MTILPTLSILIPTYNHESFIAECINGVFIQKINFPIEIIIGDDCSTDNSQQIINNETSKNKDPLKLIHKIFHKKNLSFPPNIPGKLNWISCLNKAKGKYLIICEGDDYWTDPYKLQKQVDFLEANSDVGICFHRAILLKEHTKEIQPIPTPFENEPFDYIELIRHHNFIATASVVFRKPENFTIPQWFYHVPFGDLALYKIATQNNKKIQCINEVMSVYRIHESGVWSGIDQKKAVENYLNFYLIIYDVLSPLEKKEASKKIKKQLRQLAALKFSNNKLAAMLYYLVLLIKHYNYL